MAMVRYLILWELDPSVPCTLSKEESMKMFEENLALFQRGLEAGFIKDGGFTSLTEGFSIMEAGDEKPNSELMPTNEQLAVMKYHVKKVIPLEEIREMGRKRFAGSRGERGDTRR